ncbi:hypothetical protein CDD80_7570 [Ophiocordyceps camponoti-rufipedis]|uniref:Cytochrome c oxidase assembly factor 6 n=1 Tax=Ophiocordyceps camponoti-rufipedis TaxID=2004952 RepID=A0A2C5ZAA2_9HYPO|nr:hypothetical protein CDD80_7570 [Ophiocordyceps camponoti-rufipedis]
MPWWWPFQSSSSSPRAQEIRTGASVPTRAERQKCWSSRDAYFSCLDGLHILDPASAPRACRDQARDMERDCAAAWVDYFKKFRVAEAKKKEALRKLQEEGAVQVPLKPEFGDGKPPA